MTRETQTPINTTIPDAPEQETPSGNPMLGKALYLLVFGIVMAVISLVVFVFKAIKWAVPRVRSLILMSYRWITWFITFGPLSQWKEDEETVRPENKPAAFTEDMANTEPTVDPIGDTGPIPWVNPENHDDLAHEDHEENEDLDDLFEWLPCGFCDNDTYSEVVYQSPTGTVMGLCTKHQATHGRTLASKWERLSF